MTNRQGRGPDPNDQASHLSEEEVERRLGGDAGLGGPVPECVGPPAPSSASSGRTGRDKRGGAFLWRDVVLVLVLLGFLGAGAQFVLQRPLAAVGSPTPGTSEVAIASSSAGPIATPPSLPTEVVGPTDVIGSLAPEVTPTPRPTPTPVPTPTRAPGATPKPTPKPTPGTATLVVYLQTIVDDGGIALPSDWSVKVKVGTTTIATFAGSTAGHTVHVPAGSTYVVSATGPTGYVASTSGDCNLVPAAGSSHQCTITENDKPATLFVKVSVSDGSPADQFEVTLIAPNANPSSPVAGSASGTPFELDAHSSYSVSVTGPSGYLVDASGCSGSNIANGGARLCTVFVTASAAADMADASAASTTATLVWAPALVLAIRRRREPGRERA